MRTATAAPALHTEYEPERWELRNEPKFKNLKAVVAVLLNCDFDDKKQSQINPNKANLNPFRSHLPVQMGGGKPNKANSAVRQSRQEDMESQTMAGRAFGDEFPLMGMDGLAGEEQFQTDLFAGTAIVERVEDLFQGMGLKPLAVVLDDQMEIIAGRQHGGKSFLQRAVGQGEGDEAAAFMEPLPAVEAQVEDDLLELGGIRIDLGATGMAAELEFDLVRDDAAENLEAFLDGRRQRDGLAVDGLALGKGADLGEKFAAAIAGLKDLLQRFMGGVSFMDVHGDELAAAEDASDDVVEFMGDVAGKLVEGLEFLLQQKPGFIAGGGRRTRCPGPGGRGDFSGGAGVAWLHLDVTGASVGRFDGGGDKKFSSGI